MNRILKLYEGKMFQPVHGDSDNSITRFGTIIYPSMNLEDISTLWEMPIPENPILFAYSRIESCQKMRIFAPLY